VETQIIEKGNVVQGYDQRISKVHLPLEVTILGAILYNSL
jgi:hypothetical protein